MRLFNWIFSPISVALVISPIGVVFLADYFKVMASPMRSMKSFDGSIASFIMYILVGLVGLYLLFFMIKESRDWIRRELDERARV